MNKKYTDIFIARWLNDELSEEEVKDFESSSDFLLYKKIATKSTEFKIPEFDKERVLSEIKNKIDQKKEIKTVPIFKKWMYLAVASVVFIMGLFYFINLPEKHVTDYGEQLAVTLPDGSQVVLNSKTVISYSKKSWNTNRTIKLKGEAYFKVQKGSSFIVKTKEGSVAVLGTQFNVKADTNFFEVVCYEGKVEANTTGHKSILKEGNAYRKIKDALPEKWDVLLKEPSWKTGESAFKSTPLKYVIKALENQYKITFDISKIDTSKKFTGSFTHNNLKIALQTVFVPMEIGTTFTGEKTVMLEKQSVNE